MTTEAIIPLAEAERDALCEIGNVAMARAAASLRQMVGRQILLTVPTCEILSPERAAERVVKSGISNLVAVRQDFSGPFSGSALLIFPERGSLELMRAILGRQLRPEDILDLEEEALAETGNIILNSWVGTIANLLKQSLKMSLPSVIRRDQHHIFDTARAGECVLFLHVRFEISHHKVQGYVAITMDLPSVKQLRSLITALLKSLNSETN